MAEPSLQLGNGNWAGKSGNLLAYHKANNNFYADELTFTRASTGTIVNADGLIEEVPYNLLQQSNTFDTTWINQLSGTIVGGQSGYDGTDNAWKLSKSAATFKSVRQVITTSGIQTLSAYLKADTLDKASLRIDATNVIFVDFDLTNGTYSISGGFPTSANIQEVSNGWYRADVTFNESITNVHIYVDKSNATSGSIFVQDAQLNKGATAKPYFPTTTRLNFPRVDYLNNPNGSLLLEPQRTNFITQSSNLSLLSKVAVGTASPPVTTANYATSPDGTQNATRVVFDLNGGSDRSILRQAIPLGSDYYFSIYVKSTNGTDQKVMFHDGDEQNTYNVTNEWQRITYDGRSGISYAGIALTGNSGADTSDILVWGFQVEQGSYATSIINTAGATVTRLADASATTGISDVIGQTEGTMFVDFVWKGLSSVVTDNSIFSLGNQEYGNSSIAISNYNGTLYGRITNGTSVDASVNYGAMTSGTRYKCAIGYANNDFVFYVNGVQIGSDTSVSIPARSDVYLQNAHPNSKSVNQAQLYKTRLTNAELITLTTL